MAAAPSKRRAEGKSGRAHPISVVVLVRHGKTPTTGAVLPGRAPGLHLSEEGRQQADALGTQIAAARRRPSAVYASPMERTRETAAPIARALGLRVRTDRGLLECDVGTWTGAALRTVAKDPAWRAVQRWPSSFRFPHGESFAEMSNRISEALLNLVAAHRGETIVAVSHADPIKAALAAVAGIPLDLFQRLVVSPCSVSAIAYGDGGPQVLCMNATTALLDVMPS
jgi:probable phosphoglycerate mutase